MAVWCTNTSSLVSFLLMKPYPFLTLNHLTVPKTFVAMTFLPPPAGAADAADGTGAVGGGCIGLDPVDQCVAGIDIDARIAVCEPVRDDALRPLG